MTVIAIRMQQKTDAGFAATVSFDHRAEYPIQIQNPFDAKQERRLAWYFERWIHQPTKETVIAAQVPQSLQDYGDRLFTQACC